VQDLMQDLIIPENFGDKIPILINLLIENTLISLLK